MACDHDYGDIFHVIDFLKQLLASQALSQHFRVGGQVVV